MSRFKANQRVVKNATQFANPLAPSIKKGEVVTVKGYCTVYPGNVDIVEYPKAKNGAFVSYDERSFDPFIEPLADFIEVTFSEIKKAMPITSCS